MRAVCKILVTLVTVAIIQNGGLAGRTDKDTVHTLNEVGHSEEDAPFTQVNIFLTELELQEWHNGDDVKYMSYEDSESMVDILLHRFECDEVLDTQHCQACTAALTNHIYDTVGPGNVAELSEDEFVEASAILFYLFSYGSIEMTCNSTTWMNTVEEYVAVTMATDGSPDVLTENELDILLDYTASGYHPALYSKCFDFESLYHDYASDHDGATEEEVYQITSSAVSYMIQGYCIGTPTQISPDAFREDIFHMYGDHEVIPEAGFEEMLTALSIGSPTSGHDHIHAITKRRVFARDTDAVRTRRSTEHNHDHDHSNSTELEDVTSTCFSGEELLDIHGVDHQLGMTEQQFVDTCPSLLQQILRGTCDAHTETVENEIPAEVWIYGSIAVLVISLGSLVGGLIIPWCPRNYYEKIILVLISLAVAVLVGDAIMHLIPLALGIHVHEEGTAHSPLDPELAYVWKCLCCVLAVYLFYVTEALMGWWSNHYHSHSGEYKLDEMRESENNSEEFNMDQRKESEKKSEEINMDQKKEPENGEILKSYSETALIPDTNSSPLGIFGNFLNKYGTLPLMVLVGDGLHNFGDGLAVGAAFSVGIGSGVSTTIAMFCHEVPHELGDLAILLRSGIKLKWALFLNFLSALTAFVGLYIGIGLASTEAASQWIFAITAGMFLYVALADMMPQITSMKNVKDPMWTFFLQNVAFLVGTGIILVIALYEDAIRVSI